MKLSTAWFTEKCLHPVTRSSVLLPRVEDYRVWDPFPADNKKFQKKSLQKLYKIKKARASKSMKLSNTDPGWLLLTKSGA
jgi:hypothetical protein